LDSSKSLSRYWGKRFLLITSASILLLTTFLPDFGQRSLAEVASSQTEQVSEQEAMRHLVGQMIQIGTTQYERGYYAQAEKTLLMTQAYLEYLTAAERNKLNELLEKTQLAALERKRALEHKQTANELFKQGESLKAKAYLEKIKDNSFLTAQEQEQNSQLLKQIESQIVKASPSPAKAKAGQEKVAQSANGGKRINQPDERKKQVAETYYRSMRLYRSGQLEKAREGFIEIVQSGLIPPAMVKTLQGYLTQIDNTLGRNNQNSMPSGLTEINPEMERAEPNIAPQVAPEITELQIIEPQRVAPEVIKPEVTIPKLPEPEIVAPAPTPVFRQEDVRAEPATREESYIEVIKRNRNILQSYTKAIVNDAMTKAQDYIRQGQFDKAEEVVGNAERIVNRNQLHLGDNLNAQYNNGLKQLNEQIIKAKQEQIRQSEEQKRTEAVEAQRQFREQMETDRHKRIQTLMENATAYTKQQRYEAALGQLETLLALDPQNKEALLLKDALEDMVYMRKQLEVHKEKDKQRADILLKTDESGIPYAEELVYPKNWREIMEKPTRQPDKPIGLDPADVVVYEQLDQIVDLSQLTPTMPLNEAIELLKNRVTPPLKITVFWRDLLDNAEIEPTTEINMDGLPSVRLGTGLENLLNAVAGGFAQLGYIVKDGVITIATVESLPSKMETRVYDITDLVGQPANFGQMGMMGMGGFGGGLGGFGGGLGGFGGGLGGFGGGGYGGGGYGGGLGGFGGGLGGFGGGGYGGGLGGFGGGGYGGYGGGGYGGGGYGGYGGGGYGGGGYGGGGYGGGGYGGGGYGGGGYGGGGYGGGGYGGGGYGGGGYGGGGYGGGFGGGFDTSRYRAEDLVLLIQDTIEPDTWYDYGGEGTITLYPRGEMPKKLAVLQTREVHTEIEKLLKELRKALGHQVSIEARFLIVSENFLQDIGLDIDFTYNLGGPLSTKWGLVTVEQDSALAARADVATKVPGSLGGLQPAATLTGGYGTILDDLQVSFLLRMTQARTDAETLTAPKATVLSGESAMFYVQSFISYALPPDVYFGVYPGAYAGAQGQVSGVQQNIGGVPTGSVLSISPTITPDKKNVLLNIVTQLQDLLRFRTHIVSGPVGAQGEVQEYPVTIPETETSQIMTRVSVPDGGTLLLGGQKISAEVEKEVGVPILSKIPIIGIAFSNRSKISDHKILLILVKPTIILQEERETEAIAALEKEL